MAGHEVLDIPAERINFDVAEKASYILIDLFRNIDVRASNPPSAHDALSSR